ncbi:MAG: ATP-dependent helicase, partial [Nocardioidaceae bacterium]|nr:ATP-dependent helicase [Nocardioidaceae bacterium]
AAAREAGRSPRGSAELLRAALFDPAAFADLTDPLPGEQRATALAVLLARTRAQLEEGASVEELLWTLWDGTSWPGRLRSAIGRGGLAARLAHRDLDAVVALFDAAARAEEARGHTGPASFLDTLRAQQIPGDTLAERGIRDEAVRLLTAHRAKGLEWPLVVVAHVQEDSWPDLRRRATLLRADLIGSHGLVPPTSTRALLADERRLFYVACTRARERLVVTAVASSDDEGEQRSRFLEELFPDVADHRIVHVTGRPRRPLSLAGLVAELRRTVADPDQSPQLRQAAALRLARLAAAHQAGELRVPAADPATWWGTRAWTHADEAMLDDAGAIPISASALTGLVTCPAQWFLHHEAGGERLTTQAQGFGNVVHTLADRIGRGEEEVTPDLVERLMAHVDEVWGRVPFRTPWSGDRERAEVEAALHRFLVHTGRAGARRLVATEQQFRTDVSLPDGQRVVLHGYADRLEIDHEGRVVVIDLKTGKTAVTGEELAQHPQLGLYQLAAEHGAFDQLLADLPDAARPTQAGGAELWQLRQQLRTGMKVQAQPPQTPDADGLTTVERQLTEAVARLRDEEFPARPGAQCERCDFVRFCPAHTAGTTLS